jgi:hypothetical protein
VPPDWLVLGDRTGTINIMVPPEWIAGADNAPVQNADGTPQPRIAATTDQALFYSDNIADWFAVPGVIYGALPFETDTAAHLEATVYHDYCTPEPVQDYGDGVFSGNIQEFTNCAGTATRVVEVVANPYDAAFTAVVEIQLTGQPDDEPTLAGLLQSFDRMSTNTPPSISAPTATVPRVNAIVIVAAIQQRLQTIGVTFTEEQTRCVYDHVAETDPTDDAEFIFLLWNCGVDISDLAGG